MNLSLNLPPHSPQYEVGEDDSYEGLGEEVNSRLSSVNREKDDTVTSKS